MEKARRKNNEGLDIETDISILSTDDHTPSTTSMRKEELRATFICNYEKYMRLDMKDRDFKTKIDYKIEQVAIDTINEANVIQYASALTLKEMKMVKNNHRKRK